ncbi:MAG: hypothetical protein ACTHJM_15780 [Marmoricola sp.]
MRASRDWVPPASYTCPGCGKPQPTIGWHDDCRDFPTVLEGQTTIDEALALEENA